MPKILFQETQYFRQWWFRLIFISIALIFIYGLYKQLFLGEPFGDRPVQDITLIIISAAFVLLSLFFLYVLKLETVIKENGVYVRYFPFHLSFKHYPWNNLTRLYVRKYKPVSEYGGWGLRFGMFGKGMAYNVSGNIGLQLETTNNEKLLIGTRKGKELEKILLSIGRLTQ